MITTVEVEEKILEDYKHNRYFLAKDLLEYKDLTINFHYKYVCTNFKNHAKKIFGYGYFHVDFLRQLF